MDESFYESKLIEFTTYNDGKETIIAKFKHFKDLPSHLRAEFENNSKITFQGKKWVVLDINRDFSQHGKGMHIRVRLGQPRTHEKME